MQLVSFDEILRAHRALSRYVSRTPVFQLWPPAIDGVGELWIKAELFQPTGSFKVRGAFNALLTSDPGQRAAGVVSMSAGNHGAALAYAAAHLAIPATIVMPQRASARKMAATRSYGGEVVMTDCPLPDVVHEIQADRNLMLVHPYDDLHVIAGAGGVGIELAQDTTQLDLIVVPVGGGGLISGIAAAVKTLSPTTRVIGVEPARANAMSQALKAGHPVTVPNQVSLADGLTAPTASERTLRHTAEFVDEIIEVSEEAIEEALRFAYQHVKLACEPAAVVGLAGLISGTIERRNGNRVACIITGGNIDEHIVASIFSRSQDRNGTESTTSLTRG